MRCLAFSENLISILKLIQLHTPPHPRTPIHLISSFASPPSLPSLTPYSQSTHPYPGILHPIDLQTHHPPPTSSSSSYCSARSSDPLRRSITHLNVPPLLKRGISFRERSNVGKVLVHSCFSVFELAWWWFFIFRSHRNQSHGLIGLRWCMTLLNIRGKWQEKDFIKMWHLQRAYTLDPFSKEAD